MNRFSTWMAAAVLAGAAPLVSAQAPQAIEMTVEVGSAAGAMTFTPSELSFERGRYYKLVIHNPSGEDHYFTSDAFATHVFTRKVEVMDAAGRTIAEVHGAVNDLELKPGATVAWYFYPMTNGTDLPLACHKKGHAEAGMVGRITISGKAPFTP